MRQTLLFFTLVFCACSGNHAVPKDVLPPEKMEAVLYDVIRADEMAEFLKMSDSTYRQFSKRTALYDSVFQLHNTKKESFQKSLTYYEGRPDLLKQMLEDMQKKQSDTTRAKKRPPQAM